MDVTLGVAVQGERAVISLLDASAPHSVIDESAVEFTGDALEQLVSTLVSTDRHLVEAGHRLVGTSVYGADTEAVTDLHNALRDADLMNVSVVSQADAVTAATRSLTGGQVAASLVSDGDTAALSIIDTAADATSLIAVEPVVNGDRTAAFRSLLERFSEEPGGAASVIILGGALGAADTAVLSATSPVPLQIPDNPEFALARGVALAGRQQPMAADSGFQNSSYTDSDLNFADTMMSAQEQQLAYSEVGGDGFGVDTGSLSLSSAPVQTPMQPLSAVDPDELAAVQADADQDRPRVLLLGSAVAAVVVVGFAALAVSVAIGIRPTVSQQAVRLTDESVPGKYFPVAPGQGVTPPGPAWTMVEDLPEPGTDPEARVFQPKLFGRSQAAGDTGAEVIKLYRDNTIGVEPLAQPVAGGVTEASNVLAAGPIGGFPAAPDYLTRLIPDFSKFSTCDILGIVGNAPYAAVAGVETWKVLNDAFGVPGKSGVSKLSGGADPGDITDISNLLGTTVVVRGDQGELFSDGTIPDDVFDKSAVELNEEVLPEGAKVVEVVDTTTGKTTTPSLGEAFALNDGKLEELPTAGITKTAAATVDPTAGLGVDPGTSLADSGFPTSQATDTGGTKEFVIPGAGEAETVVPAGGPELSGGLEPSTSAVDAEVAPKPRNPITSFFEQKKSSTPDSVDPPVKAGEVIDSPVQVGDLGDKPIVAPDPGSSIGEAPVREPRKSILDGFRPSKPEGITAPEPEAVTPPKPDFTPSKPEVEIPKPAMEIPKPVWTPPPAPAYTPPPAPAYTPPPVQEYTPPAPPKPIIDIPSFSPPSSGSGSSGSGSGSVPSLPSFELPNLGGIFGSRG